MLKWGKKLDYIAFKDGYVVYQSGKHMHTCAFCACARDMWAQMLNTQSRTPHPGDFYNTSQTHTLLKGRADGNHALPLTKWQRKPDCVRRKRRVLWHEVPVDCAAVAGYLCHLTNKVHYILSFLTSSWLIGLSCIEQIVFNLTLIWQSWEWIHPALWLLQDKLISWALSL